MKSPKYEPSPEALARRKSWTVQRCDSFEDMRERAIRNWQRVSATARTDAAWEWVVDAWKLKGGNPDELRLQRDLVTVVSKPIISPCK